MSEAVAGTDLKRGLSYSALSFVSTIVLGLLSALVTSRLYGVEVLGEFAIVSTPWLIAVRISTLDEQVALARRLAVLAPGSKDVGGLFSAVLVFSLVLTSVVAVVVLLVTAVVLNGPVATPELLLPAAVVLAGYVLVDNTSWNIDTVLSSFGAGRAIFFSRTSVLVSFITAAVALSTSMDTVWGLVLATLVSFVVGLVARAWTVRPFTPLVPGRAAFGHGLRELPGIVRYGAVLFPGSLSSGLADQSAYWILGATSPISVVGAFSRAHGLARRMDEAAFRVGEILFPELVRRRHGGDHEGFARASATAAHYTGFALLLIAAAGGGVAAPVLRVFGPGFDAAADALTLLLLAYGVHAVAAVQGYSLLVALRPRVLTGLVVTRSVLTMALMVPGAMQAGATGVAAAVLAANLTIGVVSTWVLRRRVLRPGDPYFGWPLALRALVSTMVGLGASRLVAEPLPDVLALPLGAAAGAVGYLAVAATTGFVGRHDLDVVLGQLPTKLRRRPGGEVAADDGAAPAALAVEGSDAPQDPASGRDGFERLVSPVAVVDGHGVVVEANEAWQRAVDDGQQLVAGGGPGSNLVSHWRRLATDRTDDLARASAGLDAVLWGGAETSELEVRCRAPASDRWFLIQIAALDGGGAVLQLIDISLRKRLELRLARLAGHDPLTGLLNRLGVEEYLHAELAGRRTTPALVAFVDLAGIPAVADRGGPVATDGVLLQVADRLRDAAGSDEVVARLGDDAFVIVADGADADGEVARHLCRRVRAAVRRPYCVDGERFELEASVTVVLARRGDDGRAVLRRDDVTPSAPAPAHRAPRPAGERPPIRRADPRR